MAYSHGAVMPSNASMSMDGSFRELNRHVASSTVLREELMGPPPVKDEIRYVEVEVLEEVIKHVPKREVVEIEKRVPRIEYEWVEKVIEVPQITYVDKPVEVPQIQEVIRHVPRKEIIDVPREHIRHVPRIENVVVEKLVEVPGQVIEVPKPYVVENKVPVTRYVDKEVPMIVAQTVRPVITESDEAVEVDVFQYEPEVVVVDVHVPKAVPSHILAMGVVAEFHRVVNVPPAQYNTMLQILNPHIAETDGNALPYLREPGGTVPFLSKTDVRYTPAPSNASIQGWTSNYQTYAGEWQEGHVVDRAVTGTSNRRRRSNTTRSGYKRFGSRSQTGHGKGCMCCR